MRIRKRQTLFTAPRTADNPGRRQYQPSLQRFLFNAVVERRNPEALTVVLNRQAGN